MTPSPQLMDTKRFFVVYGTVHVVGYVRDVIVGVCHRTSNGQERKLMQHAGQEPDTIP